MVHDAATFWSRFLPNPNESPNDAEPSAPYIRTAMGTHARRSAPITRRPAFVESWRSQPLALRLLRAFLGVTFVYAGIQKLADPNFLHSGTPDYVGSQLQAFATGSPIGWFLRIAAHVPVLTGVGIALLEIAIGLGTLLGVARYAAAVAGLGVSVVLFLSATWHVHPYFLGSDSVYAVAWLAYLAGMWEIDRRARPVPRRSVISQHPADMGRRSMLRGALLAGATVLLAGAARVIVGKPSAAAAGFDRPARAPSPSAAGRKGAGGGSQPGSRTPAPSGPGAPGPTPAGPPPVSGRTIATLDDLPVGGAIPFSGPGGQPCALFRLAPEKVAAFSRICTHAGCEVGYDQGSRLLVCPCHGAEFDPSRGAAPVAGPAPTPLPSVRVVVDRSRGVVVLPS